MKKAYYIILFILFCYQSFSQVLIEKEGYDKNNVSILTKKVDKIFNTEKSKVFSFLVSESHNPKSHSINRFYELEKDKEKFKLDKNEYPLEVSQGNFYSYIEDVIENKREYFTSTFKGNALVKNKESLTLSLSSTVTVLKNGDLIVTDGGHSGRDWVRLYSPEMKIIHEFKPFNDESSINYDSDENCIIYAGQIDIDPLIRIALYGSFGNKGLKSSREIKIGNDLLLSSVKLVTDKIVLLFSNVRNSSSQILILDSELNIANKFSLDNRVSHNKIISQNENIFLNTKSKITSFNVVENVKNWELQKSINKPIKTKYGYKFTGSDVFLLDNNHFMLLEATHEDNKDNISDITLKIIEIKNKNIIQNIKIPDSFNDFVNLKKAGNDLMLYSSNKIKSYEIQ